MGGITSSPAVLVHRGFSDKHEKQRYHWPGLLPAAREFTGPVQLQEIQVFLPEATGLLVCMFAVEAVPPRSPSCIYYTSH